jgi:hypothetical protein
MNKTNQTNDRHWLRYIETSRQHSQPVKIDAVLQQRLQSFMAARQRQLDQAKE